jgi:predicted MPP superfamily phosphohydrolase
MIDFIGDIHGHANKLKELLIQMQYDLKNGAYYHPERKVVFLGDYIDRGPQIKETLEIVRRMVDNDNAVALMGNHEYNAICYNTTDGNDQPLRVHSEKNQKQHAETLKQLGGENSLEYRMWIEWFMTLPVFYETDRFRAVHAMWDQEHVNELNTMLINRRFTEDVIRKSADKTSGVFTAVDELLKGRELKVPDWSFTDKDGHERDDIRIKWWIDPVGKTYKQLSIHPLDKLPDAVAESPKIVSWRYYNDDRPVFFGHYWLEGTPMLRWKNICCADYSVAKEGFLAAYRFDGERALKQENFKYV